MVVCSIKRFFDIVITLLMMALLSILILLTAMLIRVVLGAPVIFKQERPGKYGKPFFLYKFRTMTIKYDKNGNLLSDQMRLTKTGRFIRKLSLDELPQLFNVLKGDISLVGPRPLLMEYLPLYTKEQARRHEVKPGMTGWAQINGRNSISWEERFTYDVWYVDHQSFWLDMKILVLTIFKVFKSEGIHQAGHATMEKFTGTGSSKLHRIVLVGAGGHSKVIQDIIALKKDMQLTVVIDDAFNRVIEQGGIIYAPTTYLNNLDVSQYRFCLAIGSNQVRRRLFEQYTLPLSSYITLIHPQSIISPSAQIGHGTVVMAGAIIHAGTSIGHHSIINTGSIIEHDNDIADFVHISPHATLAGTVIVGEGSQIGASATVIQNKQIGRWSMIGAGAVVISHVEDDTTVVGIPARPI